MGWMIVGFLVLSLQAGQSPPAEIVTTYQQFYDLSPQQALQGRPVQLKGVVLCYDAGWNQLYLYNEGLTDYFAPRLFTNQLKVGQFVEVTGATTFLDGRPAFTNLHLTVLGSSALPKAKPLKLSELGSDFGQWIEIEGKVRVAETSSERLSLVLHERGQSCLIYVMGLPGTHDYRWLWGCRVKIQGINASQAVNGHLDIAHVFCPSLQQIAILEKASSDLLQTPVISISRLLNREPGQWTNQPVHLNGLVTSCQPGQFVVIKDPTGHIRARTTQVTEIRPNQRIDLWGFLQVAEREILLSDAFFVVAQPASLPVAPSLSQPPAPANHQLEPLTQVSSINRLGRAEADQRIPVKLRGVVTFADPEWGNGFLQDQSGAIYFKLGQTEVRAGQWVELTGHTSSGGFAPQVVDSAVRILAATNFPPPAQVGLEEVAGGHWDAHWIELEGVIRQADAQWGHAYLVLMTGKGSFKAVIPGITSNSLPDHLIDALVRIRGACTSETNERGQLTGVTLNVPGLDHLQVIEAGTADPFAVPTTPIASVGTFNPERRAGRRVKVSGVVTLVLPAEGFVLQDASGGIRVHTQRTDDVQRGDQVDVLGFPTFGEYLPCLEQVHFHTMGRGQMPLPKKVTAERILLHGTNDQQVVSLESRLVQDVLPSRNPQLILQAGAIIFTARFAVPLSGQSIPPLLSGSLIRLTGVCSIQAGGSRQPKAFHLLLPHPEAIQVLQAPPWWDSRRILMLAGGMAAAIIVSLAWVALLRRQVKAQTDLIRRNQDELLRASRLAGMAEVATGVLHNVGNVLNSVNVSTTLLGDCLRQSRITSLCKATALLQAHMANLPAFLTEDPKGKMLPSFLINLGKHLADEQTRLLQEVDCLSNNIEHLKRVVTMQQSYARVGGMTESLPVTSLVEDVLQMNAPALHRQGITIIRQFDPVPPVTVDKHKVMQILMNLLHNALAALAEAQSSGPKILVLGIARNGSNRVKITVTDNGIGILPENLTRIFSFGFTTKKEGHGFGLHLGALTAREMGGTLSASSQGPGSGATFILELPMT